MTKELVVYYSYSGNTRKCAKLIGELTGADLLEIKPVEKYPEDVWAAIDVFKEDFANGSRRAIQSYKVMLADYDVIYIGTPNWGYTVATPLLAFFDKENLSDKVIKPFVTHGGGGLGNCASDIIKLSKSSQYSKPFVYTNDKVDKKSLEHWLKVDR